MLWFIVRRLLISVLVVLGILTLNFVLIHAAPGSPADLLLNPEFDDDYNERLAEAYGLNDPVWEQYLKYLDNVLLHFDLARRRSKEHRYPALPGTQSTAMNCCGFCICTGPR